MARSALIDAVRDFSEIHALLPEGTRVVAGLSGGVDSIVLVHVLRALGVDVVAAHVDYGLREASEADRHLVSRYCKEFRPEISLCTERCDPEERADRTGESLQEAARHQRYAFFARVAAEEGSRHVAVGHHQDDQAETFLLNALRGSGPEGLAAMRPKRRLETPGEPNASPDGIGMSGRPSARCYLVRPLLNATRSQIEAYARAHELEWREDASNRDVRFKRAALRRDVLPALEAHFPGARTRLARTSALVGRYVDEALRPALARRFEAATAEEPPEALRLDALREAPPVWRGRLLLEGLRRFCPEAPRSERIARELEDLLEAQPGRKVVLGGGSVWRERGVLRYVSERSGEAVSGDERRLAPGQPARWQAGMLRARVLDAVPQSLDHGTRAVAFLDADRLAFPLTVRRWRSGDRFQPLGMRGTKRVSDLLTDEKVSPSERRRVRVVCTEGRIAWVVNHRIAEPAKVRASTQRVARLTFTPAVR